ncbi:SrfA family protein [Pantoea allii]|uniref:SrfA family protein n=1 Tax=Pantoea allii TaxID=574096 RepID=UPI0024B84473|nr:SrfA family protein [Pantoea allii]MDJ0035702.1 SrfA family protein [Pantoea allii]
MAKTFLRSGNLDAVLALGENGQPVFASALQIRETLRLRRQSALANCLAIPQTNERGDRLDWYSPFPGKVKSWMGASDYERRQALQHLTACQQDLQEISARARDAANPAMRLFGALLGKSLQFPNQQYVYLVNGKPVITFWGFVDAQERNRDDALACLRDSLEESLPTVLVEPPPEPVAVAAAPEPEPVVTPEPEVTEPTVSDVPVQAPEPVPVAAVRRRPFRLWYLIPTLAVAAAAATAVILHMPKSEPVTTAQPVAQNSPAPAPVIASKPPAVVASAEKLSATLPQKPAAVVANAATATASAPSSTLSNVVVPAVPAKPEDLVVTPDAVRDGQVQVIDGRWRVEIDQVKTPTGKPPVMRFQFKNGKGNVQINQGNTTCKADVTAAMTSAGNLVIESRFTARCADKSRYRMPLLVCHSSIGAAACEAQYSGDRTYPITIKRESK